MTYRYLIKQHSCEILVAEKSESDIEVQSTELMIKTSFTWAIYFYKYCATLLLCVTLIIHRANLVI